VTPWLRPPSPCTDAVSRFSLLVRRNWPTGQQAAAAATAVAAAAAAAAATATQLSPSQLPPGGSILNHLLANQLSRSLPALRVSY